MNAIVKTKRSERVNIFHLHIFTKETHFYISPIPCLVVGTRAGDSSTVSVKGGVNQLRGAGGEQRPSAL